MLVNNELKKYITGAKIEKIHQPSKNELVIIFRTRTGAYRLYLSCDGQSPRVHLTRYAQENPKVPPMICMLIRKLLTGAVLEDIRQIRKDRILVFDFSGTTEIGDRTKYHLICEILGPKSNIILCNSEYVIIDALRRVEESSANSREILPGLKYEEPFSKEKSDILETDGDLIVSSVVSKNALLSKAVLDSVDGISPIVAREIAYRTVFGDKEADKLLSIERERLASELGLLKEQIMTTPRPQMLLKDKSTPFDFSFTDIRQYGKTLIKRNYQTFCELLDDFYFERDRQLRIKRKAGDLFKILGSAVERTSRKINNRKLELEKSENREQLRIYAELITANQYRLTEKSSVYEVENYYENNSVIKIPASPALTAQQNAQKYYKEYKKAANAEKLLHSLIEQGEQELIYLDSVLDALSRAETESEIAAIRAELEKEGYLKQKKTKNSKKEKQLPPLNFVSEDGFKILVGRNNVQNDYLTFKTAKNHDIWLHVQKQPGSHVIIVSENSRPVSEKAVFQAAVLAAYYSKAQKSSSVAVDYTEVKNVKKPNGALPGKVIYTTYKTVFVTPDEDTVKELTVK